MIKNDSPLLTIWLKPRLTIRMIIDTYNKNHLLPYLLVTGGIGGCLFQVSNKNIVDKAPDINILILLLIVGIFGMFVAYSNYYVFAPLLKWAGKFLGGKSSLTDMQQAIQWAYIPYAVSLLIWLPAIMIFQKEMFSVETPLVNSSIVYAAIFMIITITLTILFLWAWFIRIKAIAEAHQFSFWRALACIIIVFSVLSAPFILIGLCAMLARL